MSGRDVFLALKSLLEPYASRLSVRHDTDEHYYLEGPGANGDVAMFGAVQVKKSYTAFPLFPIYFHPDLIEDITPALKKRMQGKSCFNFTQANQIPREELASLVERAFHSR